MIPPLSRTNYPSTSVGLYHSPTPLPAPYAHVFVFTSKYDFRSIVGSKNTRPFLAIQQQQQPLLLQVFRKIEKEIVTKNDTVW